MRSLRLAVLRGCAWRPGKLFAQHATIQTPMVTGSSGFFEQPSVQWSGHWAAPQFQFGNPGLAQPAFGGANSAAGLSTGLAILGPNSSFNLHFNWGQGASQSLVGQTPSITMMNGQSGFFSDSSQTPFVMGFVPVVGGPSMVAGMPLLNFDPSAGANEELPSAWGNSRVQDFIQAHSRGATAGLSSSAVPRVPADQTSTAGQAERRWRTRWQRLAAAQESSAGRPAPSVAEARRMRELEQTAEQKEVQALWIRARTAEEDGKPGVARIYYQMVAKRATGDMQRQAIERLDALRTAVR